MLESTQLDAIEKTRPTTPPPPPEPVVEVVYQSVDPVYHETTRNTVVLAETLQHKMDYARKLTDEIKSYRKWNPLLEQDLQLDEKDLREYIRNVKKTNSHLASKPNLQALYDDIQKSLQS